jgi:hemerythrin superfamily protein
MDAITLLKNDHRTVEKLFKEFEKTGDRAVVTRGKLAQEIIRELSIHAAIEEQAFYPTVRDLVEGQEDMTLESIEEHHVMKWLLSEIQGRDPVDERFLPKMTVLIELVRHHVEEEESELFPAVRAALGRKRLVEMGEALEKAKRAAPTRPHPRSPDEPPANALVGAVAGAVDRAREAVDGLRQS